MIVTIIVVFIIVVFIIVLRIWYSITIDVAFTTFFQRSFNFIFARVFHRGRTLGNALVECCFRLPQALRQLGQLLRAEQQQDDAADDERLGGTEHGAVTAGDDYGFGRKR